jgi:hypothetical protein
MAVTLWAGQEMPAECRHAKLNTAGETAGLASELDKQTEMNGCNAI